MAELDHAPEVTPFFHQPTGTYSYLVRDPNSRACAIIDPVLDYDGAAGRTGTQSVDAICAAIARQDLEPCWILETHAHADHLSAAQVLKERYNVPLGIGRHIRTVQQTFARIYNAGPGFATDGTQFDRLFDEGETFAIGGLAVRVLHTPGHTPACLTYVIGDAAFVGDTLFMPDGGTARCDFPGGDARTLYASIMKIFDLPGRTRLFVCHDYGPGGREPDCETTVAAQRQSNIHVGADASEDEFVARREERDATLGMPALIIPAIQVNMRAGSLPPAETNGTRYLKIPLDVL